MKQKQYIREIIQRSCLPAAQRKRLRNDLENEICAALERGESMEQIKSRMGDPDEVAAELYENFSDTAIRPFREYKSKRTLLGLPLVHIIRANYANRVPGVRLASARMINVGGRYGNFGLPTARGIFAFGPKAKGFLAVGNLAAGFISVGNISTGIISIGNLSAGLISIGNIALALLFALANVAAGIVAAGNAALGYAAAGNFALGEYAIGNETAGTFTFSITNLSAQLEQIKLFFAGLDAPSWVKSFFEIVEKVLSLNETTAVPLIITSLFLLAVIAIMLWAVPKMLLNRNSEHQ